MKKFLKSLWIFIAGIAFVATSFAVYKSVTPSEIIVQWLKVTDNGTNTGTKIMDINSGGKIISYGQLVDWSLSQFITGWALSWYQTGTEYRHLSGGSILYANVTGFQVGRSAKASGFWAMAIGDAARAENNSIALLNGIATGIQSIAMWNCSTPGYFAFCVGNNSTVEGMSSYSLWGDNKTPASNSINLWNRNNVEAPNSMVMGNNLYTHSSNAYNPVAIWKNNLHLNNTIFELWNGADNTHLSNFITVLSTNKMGINTSTPTQALTVSGNINVTTGYTVMDSAGNTYITGWALLVFYSGGTIQNKNMWYVWINLWYYNWNSKTWWIAIGNYAYATNEYSIALWSTQEIIPWVWAEPTIASGYSSLAIWGWYAFGAQSISIGKTSIATGLESMALGLGAMAYGNQSTSIWYFTKSAASYSIAIWKLNVGLPNSIFEIGNGTSTNSEHNVMTILDNGYVWIWTTWLQSLLHVDGTAQFGNYALGNYTKFDANGFERRYGSWLARDDIQNLQMRDTDTAGEKPTLTNISGSNIKTRCFDWAGGGSTRMMYGNVEIPHDMYTGTGAILSPHIHWMWTTTANTTGVRWLDYTIIKANQTYSSTVTISWTYSNITARGRRVDDIDGDFSATGLALGDTISFRIYRNSALTADTYGGDMCLSQFGFHYQRDTNGSRTEYIK